MRLTRAHARGPGLAWQLPLLLRHAALCRLALPNLCLKLNLKEKNKTNPKQTKESGTSFLLDFSSSARGEGAVGSGMRERFAEPLIPPSLPSSLPGVLGEGQGTDLDLKPAAPSFVLAEMKPQTDAASQPQVECPPLPLPAEKG